MQLCEQKTMKKKIQRNYYKYRKLIWKKWKRVLPFSEYFVDRWEKASFLKFGEKTSIYDSSFIYGDVEVGKETWIGPQTILDGSGERLEIGNHCSISVGVQIYTHDTVKNCISGGVYHKEIGAVFIGDNCYIAPGAIISRGVILGNRCIVCAQSFVNKSFEDGSIIGGIPARKIGEVIVSDKGEIELRYYSHKGIENSHTKSLRGGERK